MLIKLAHRLVGVPHPSHQVSEGRGKLLGVVISCCVLLFLKHFTRDCHSTKLRLNSGQSFDLQREPCAKGIKLLENLVMIMFNLLLYPNHLDLVLDTVGAVVLLLSVKQGHLLLWQKKARHVEPTTAGVTANPPDRWNLCLKRK